MGGGMEIVERPREKKHERVKGAPRLVAWLGCHPWGLGLEGFRVREGGESGLGEEHGLRTARES